MEMKNSLEGLNGADTATIQVGLKNLMLSEIKVSNANTQADGQKEKVDQQLAMTLGEYYQIDVPHKSYVEVLTPGASECDIFGNRVIWYSRCDVRMKKDIR